MKALWLTDEQAREILEHARAEAPREACGLIAGRSDRTLRAVEIIPVENSAADPLHRYEMDRAVLSRHLPRFERDGLELIGLYHSHPSGEPIPSPTDIVEAAYPDTAYVIVGLRGNAPNLAAWHIHYGMVNPVELHIGTLPPANVHDIPPLSDAQRFAVIAAALLAFIVLVALSLYLLPAAPEIPR